MSFFDGIYTDRKVMIAGHTGFKGSWLALWLKHMGASITGIALDPVSEVNHWDLLQLKIADHRIDINDRNTLMDQVYNSQPEIVFHLAAQPLVRTSFTDPHNTWQTNVMGTVNLLEACRKTPSVKAIVIITTDKCYENKEWIWGYRENDRLGGHDPYSASKAACELVVESYRKSFFSNQDSPLIASARAGNVIGGGDWSLDRLIPDIVRSVNNEQPLEIRSPKSTRPWQHVLESLSGYLSLGQKLLERKVEYATSWNFGPDYNSNISVDKVLTTMKKVWPVISWNVSKDIHPHEATLLHLDSSKARKLLNWQPLMGIDETLNETAKWYKELMQDKRVISQSQLNNYLKKAEEKNVGWAIR